MPKTRSGRTYTSRRNAAGAARLVSGTDAPPLSYYTALFTVLLSLPAFAPQGSAAEPSTGIDCKTAHAPIERLICADRLLTRVHVAMGVAFGEAQSRAGVRRGRVVVEQRQWLARRGIACPGIEAAAGGPPEGPAFEAVTECLQRIYEQRIAMLQYDHNKADWPKLPFRPVLLEGAGTPLCDDLRRDFEASFLGPSLFLNPLGEREVGFAPIPVPGADPAPLRAAFDPYNHGRPVLVLQWIFDNGGLHLATVRYRRFASSTALAAVLRQPDAAADLFNAGEPVVDTDALPQPDTGRRRIEGDPYFTRSQVFSVDEAPHYFRYAGRVYVLAPLQPAARGMADSGVYELSGPTRVTRRCLFQAHFPMAYSPYDMPDLGAAAQAAGAGSAAGPLLPAGKVCPAAGDGPRTLWDHETYRPWVLEHRSWSVAGIDPPALARYLRNRGLTGLEQHLAYRRYIAARQHAIDATARYFVDRFARPAEAAGRLAALQTDWDVIDGSVFVSQNAETMALLAEDFEPRHGLQAAVFDGNADKVKSLLGANQKEAVRHATTALDEPLLSDALQHPDMVRILLDAGLDPNETGASGRTALMVAARLDLVDSARILVERGAAVDAASGDKVSQIYPLADDALCQYGGDWDPNDAPGRTPLSYAAELASRAMVRLLLDHGAGVDKTDSRGRLPADYAAARSDTDTAREITAMLQLAK